MVRDFCELLLSLRAFGGFWWAKKVFYRQRQQGLTSHCFVALRLGETWQDLTRLGVTWQDLARLGETWRDLASLGSYHCTLQIREHPLMMSDVFWGFLTPHPPPNPILSNFSSCPYIMMSVFDPQTPSPPTPPMTLYTMFFHGGSKNLPFFSHFWQKILSSKLIKKSVKRNFVGKRKITLDAQWGKIVSETKVKNPRIMECPIFAKLPTPLFRFCPILLDPPPTPQKSDIINGCSLRVIDRFFPKYNKWRF